MSERSDPTELSVASVGEFRCVSEDAAVSERSDPTELSGASVRGVRVRVGGRGVSERQLPWVGSAGVACAAVVPDLDPSRIPEHVAIVMDGNGRWAQRRGLKRTDGHAAGEEALFDTVEGGLEIGLPWMTVYAFSTENWRRPLDEVRFLMRFNESLLLRRRDDLNARGVRVRFIGRRGGRVPRRVLQHIADTEELTARNRRMTLTFAFNYGGRAEIVDAVRAIATDVSHGKTKPAAIDEKMIRRHLYAPDMPDPDLLVRTSGEYRISNYLLWELAYSELVFTDVLWPDFRRAHLFDAIREYQGRSRRFGAIDEA